MADYETRLVFSAQDRATQSIDAVARAMAGLGDKADSTGSRLTQSLSSVQAAIDSLNADTFGQSLQQALQKNAYAVDAFEEQISSAFDRLDKQARLKSAGVEASLKGLGVRSLSSIRDEIKGLGTAFQFAQSGGASAGELTLAKSNLVERTRELARQYSDVRAGISSTAQAARQAEPAMTALGGATGMLTKAGAVLLGLFAAGGIVSGISSTAKDAALLAARFDTLGIVMQTVGRNTGHLDDEMEATSRTLQSQGISMLESRQAAVSLAAAQMDLSKATKLASLAQDAAVISGDNSSQAFAKLIAAIQTGQPEMLRALGIYVSFEDAYRRVAAARGIDSASLSEQEKMHIRLNAVLEFAPRLMGTYEAAMGTAGKQITSFKRYVEDLKTELGKPMQPQLAETVQLAANAVKYFGEQAKSPAMVSALEWLGKTVKVITMSMLGLAEASNRAFQLPAMHGRATELSTTPYMTDEKGMYGKPQFFMGQKIDRVDPAKTMLGMSMHEYNALDYAAKQQALAMAERRAREHKAMNTVTYGTVVKDGELAAVAEAEKRQKLTEVSLGLDKYLESSRSSQPRNEQLGNATKSWVSARGKAEDAVALGKQLGDMELVRKGELAIVTADKELIDSREKINKSFDKNSEAAGKFESRAAKLLETLRDENTVLQEQLSGDSFGAAMARNEREFNRALADIVEQVKFAKGSIEDLTAAKAELDKKFQAKNELTRREYWLKDLQSQGGFMQSMAEYGQGDPYEARIFALWTKANEERMRAGEDQQKNLQAQQVMEAGILAVQRDQLKARAEARAELARLKGDARGALDAEISILEAQKQQVATGEERALIEEKIARLAAKRDMDIWALVNQGLNDSSSKALDEFADKVGSALPSAFDYLGQQAVTAFEDISAGSFNAQKFVQGLTAQIARLGMEILVAAAKMEIMAAMSSKAASVDFDSPTASGQGGSGTSLGSVTKYAGYAKDAYNLFGGASSGSYVPTGLGASLGTGTSGSLSSMVGGTSWGATSGVGASSGWGAYSSGSMFTGTGVNYSAVTSATAPTASAGTGLTSALGAGAIGGGVAYMAGGLMRPDTQMPSYVGAGVGFAAGAGASALGIGAGSAMATTLGLSSLGGPIGIAAGLIAATVMSIATPATKKSEWTTPAGSRPAIMLAGGELVPSSYGVIKTTTSGMFGSSSTSHSTIFQGADAKMAAEEKAALEAATSGLTEFSKQLGFSKADLSASFKDLTLPAIAIPEGMEEDVYKNIANLKAEVFLASKGLKAQVDALLKSGETYIDAMGRISGALLVMENVGIATGFTIDRIAAGLDKIAQGDYASRLIEAAGGADVLSAALSRLSTYGFSNQERMERSLMATAEATGRALAEIGRADVTIENFWTKFRQAVDQGMDPAQVSAWVNASARMEQWENAKQQARQLEIQSIQETTQALEAQKQAQDDLARSMRDFADSMSTLRESIRLDRSVSPLSVTERLSGQKERLDRLVGEVKSGDTRHLGDIDGAVKDLLETGKEAYGADQRYYDLFTETSAKVEGLETYASAQATQAELQSQQLAVQIAQSQTQIQALNTINAGIGEVVSAVNNVSQAIGGAIQAANAAQQTATVPQWAAMAIPVDAPSAAVQVPQAQQDASSSYAAMLESWGWTSSVPAYALGGDHPGGVRLAGEIGPEIENVGPARYFTASQTRDIMAPVDMAPVVGLLRDVVRGIDALAKQDSRIGEAVTGKLADVRRGLRDVEDRLS